MSELQNTSQAAQDDAQGAIKPAEQQSSTEASGGAQAAADAAASSNSQATETDTWAGLPEEFAWVKDKVTSSNAEAAKYRTQLREAETKLSEAKTPEEFEAARVELAAKNAELELELARTKAASKYGLSAEDMEILDGIADPEALEAKAEKLAARVKREPAAAPEKKGDLRGGRGNQAPGDLPKEEDGRSLWKNFRSRR